MPTPEEVLAAVQFEKEEVRKLFEHSEQLIVGIINHPFVSPEEDMILKHAIYDLDAVEPMVEAAKNAIRSIMNSPPP